MDEVLDITLQVTRILERLNVQYLVGGSLASSLHGIPRSTQDVDIVVEIRHEHVRPLVQALEGTFFIDANMIHDAITRRYSFNVIHLETMFKIDVFIPSGDDISRHEMARRHTYVVSDEPYQELVVASAEDIILQKLHWFKSGDEVSDRQWQDVMGVMKVRGDDLDFVYLEETAARMEVAELLARAYADAGLIDHGLDTS